MGTWWRLLRSEARIAASNCSRYVSEERRVLTSRTAAQAGIPVKELFALFPGKPAKKMAYVAGLPKPKGCV